MSFLAGSDIQINEAGEAINGRPFSIKEEVKETMQECIDEMSLLKINISGSSNYELNDEGELFLRSGIETLLEI
jgi:hypothetical protein